MAFFSSTKRNRSENDKYIDIGIKNCENNIKTYYNSLSKMIIEDIKELQKIKISSDVSSSVIEYIDKIIQKLINIKDRIDDRRHICAYFLDVEEDKRQSKKSRLETISTIDLKNFNFYKDFVNIMNFYMKIFTNMKIFKKEDVDKIYREYTDFLTDWYDNEADVDHIKHLYAISLRNIAQKSADYKNLYDTNYYSSLYNPQFERSKIPDVTGGLRNKSIYTDMNIKYIKGLCKANQIKLSQTKNEKRIVYTKKELITKLKRKKII
jgi:hypothetical protein